jgi:hypothetical protein
MFQWSPRRYAFRFSSANSRDPWPRFVHSPAHSAMIRNNHQTGAEARVGRRLRYAGAPLDVFENQRNSRQRRKLLALTAGR